MYIAISEHTIKISGKVEKASYRTLHSPLQHITKLISPKSCTRWTKMGYTHIHTRTHTHYTSILGHVRSAAVSRGSRAEKFAQRARAANTMAVLCRPNRQRSARARGSVRHGTRRNRRLPLAVCDDHSMLGSSSHRLTFGSTHGNFSTVMTGLAVIIQLRAAGDSRFSGIVCDPVTVSTVVSYIVQTVARQDSGQLTSGYPSALSGRRS